jgi:hypothetical protein
MGDDWGWYFTSAERRTSLLRDELDAVRSSASAQTSRLTSQLRTLQGSIETRLTALSAAFDAYVELGDIREQLAGYPDTTVVRRDVMRAVEALAGGRRAERIEDRGEAYWLPHAANAVIGLVHDGTPDEEAERTAQALSPDAELFVVAACGALGRGSLVADRLPPLLACDDALNDDQVAVWGAAVAGSFGWVLSRIREVWTPALDSTNAEVASWREWCHQRAGVRDVEGTIGWIAELLGGVELAIASGDQATATDALIQSAASTRSVRPDPGSASQDAWSPGQPLPAQLAPAGTSSGTAASRTADRPVPEAALRAVVTHLVAKGTDQEAPLLERARELRRRIEDPGSLAPEDSEPVRTPVVDAVRSALISTLRASPERGELLTWIGPALRAVAEAEAATLSSLEPVRERVNTADLDIFVTAEGPDTGQVDRARAGIAARYPESTSASAIAGGVAALFGIIGVVAIILGWGWAFVTAIVTVAAGVVAVRTERARRERRASGQAARQRLTADVAEAEQAAATRIDAREISRSRVNQLLEFIRSSVPATDSTGSIGSIESGAMAQP